MKLLWSMLRNAIAVAFFLNEFFSISSANGMTESISPKKSQYFVELAPFGGDLVYPTNTDIVCRLDSEHGLASFSCGTSFYFNKTATYQCPDRIGLCTLNETNDSDFFPENVKIAGREISGWIGQRGHRIILQYWKKPTSCSDLCVQYYVIGNEGQSYRSWDESSARSRAMAFQDCKSKYPEIDTVHLKGGERRYLTFDREGNRVFATYGYYYCLKTHLD